MLWTIDKLRELLRKQNIKGHLSDSNLSGIRFKALQIRAAFSTREPAIKNNKKLGNTAKNHILIPNYSASPQTQRYGKKKSKNKTTTTKYYSLGQRFR